jgi:putative membrane protein insertion efficiency factor
MFEEGKLNPGQKIFLKTISLYQKTLSPDHGVFKHRHPYGYCRFTPTCSEYGYEAVKKKGVIKGVLLAMWRVLRCNPWNKGGFDPVK